MSKTAELHKIDGTFRSDRHSDDIKAPMMARMPKPPDGMSAAAAEWWKKKVLDLKDMGLLYRSDLELLAVYCNLLADLDHARAQVDSALSADVRLKWTKAYNETWKVCSQVNSALGQSPLSRTKIKVERKKEVDPLDEI
jgi:P27 family predicted phage terminase small subunit